MLDAELRLRGHDLIDEMQVDAAGEQQDDEQNARDLLVVLIEHVGDRLDLLLGDRLLQAGCHGHDEKGEPADPNHGGQQMKPVVDDRDEGVEIDEDTL